MRIAAGGAIVCREDGDEQRKIYCRIVVVVDEIQLQDASQLVLDCDKRIPQA